MKLKSLQVINSEGRNEAIDLFRAVAIIIVVLAHFNLTLPYGGIGVDLFFVISGFLIGGLLTKDFIEDKEITYFRFILRRGFKIWPSYYWFLLIGSLIAYLFLSSSNPEELIHFEDLMRYLFFYQNFTGAPFHWSFDHIWSLCVEEHFYLVLPIMYIFVQKVNSKQKPMLFMGFTGFIIITGIISKYLMYAYSNSQDTVHGTHVRLDALAWGVLLNLLVVHYGVLKYKWRNWLFPLGILLIAVAIYFDYSNLFFHKVIFPSIIPFAFFLVMLCFVDRKFNANTKILSFIAYYSYNWYLWHPIVATVIVSYVSNPILATMLYLLISFACAVIMTIFIEEPFLKLRNRIVK